jgi:hypothetical protein
MSFYPTNLPLILPFFQIVLSCMIGGVGLFCLLLPESPRWLISRHKYKEAKQVKAGLLNMSSCLAPALGVTKFTIDRGMLLVILSCAG